MKHFLLLPVVLVALLSSGFQMLVLPTEDGPNPLYLPQISYSDSVQEEVPATSAPPSEPVTRPSLPADFINELITGEADVIVGAYVSDKLALPVLQQPEGQAAYVSEMDGVITQFGAASQFGTVGLLAHNYLSGQLFFDLEAGDVVTLIYGDGTLSFYRIIATQRYQALDPYNTYSDFIDQDDPEQRRISSTDVFQRVYAMPGRLVFQTCIEANGNSSWGRLFVIAEELD